jgi:threonine/homoserine/homoserine lactone efflux protein
VDPSLFGRGLVLGFGIAAAVGPITLLVIRRTLAAGWPLGLASGLGVATVDGFYGAVAAFGLTAVSDVLVGAARPLGLVGGAFLVGIGLRTVLSPTPLTPTDAASIDRRGLAAGYASIVGLTLTNPLTVLLFAALVLSLGVPLSTASAAVLTAGLALGSVAWWVVLVPGVSILRSRLSPRLLRAITLASGGLIAAFGAIAIVGVIRG